MYALCPRLQAAALVSITACLCPSSRERVCSTMSLQWLEISQMAAFERMRLQVAIDQQFAAKKTGVTESQTAVPGSLLTTMPAFKGVVF